MAFPGQRIRSCRRTVTVAQAKSYWNRSGPGSKFRKRYMADRRGQWSTVGGRVQFVSPKYEHGVEFRCEGGRIVDYAMADRTVRNKLHRIKLTQRRKRRKR